METNPVPIVIVTGSLSEDELRSPLAALEAGAVAVVRRPANFHLADQAECIRALMQTVKLMSEVKVVRRWGSHPQAKSMTEPHVDVSVQRDIKLIAIGASTGGPLVLRQILSQLPKPYPIPIVAVQHITEGFVGGFAEWLSGASEFPCRLAEDGESILPGCIYLAPDGKHMTVSRQGRVVLIDSEAEHGHVPSVSCLFRSVAEAYGAHAVGVLLTGMGQDGAAELGSMKDRGALTFAQDQSTSVVYGMPGEAVRLGAASQVLSPEKIAAALAALAYSESVSHGKEGVT